MNVTLNLLCSLLIAHMHTAYGHTQSLIYNCHSFKITSANDLNHCRIFTCFVATEFLICYLLADYYSSTYMHIYLVLVCKTGLRIYFPAKIRNRFPCLLIFFPVSFPSCQPVIKICCSKCHRLRIQNGFL